MPLEFGDVRYWVNSGRHLLAASFSAHGLGPGADVQSQPFEPVVLRCTGGHQADEVLQ